MRGTDADLTLTLPFNSIDRRQGIIVRMKSLWFVLSSALVSVFAGAVAAPSQAPARSAQAMDGHWLKAAQVEISALEYRPMRAEKKIIANNRAQSLRGEFDHSGLSVRAHGSQSLHMQFSLERFGRAENMRAAAREEPKISAGRVEFDFDGGREWYVNSSRGLEQGFDLFTRPHGGGELQLHIGVGGADLSLHDGQVLLKSAGATFSYDHLKAWDARGRILPSEMRVQGGDIVLAVNDAGAHYPITIDPLLTNVADTTFASTDNGAQLGHGLANVGDVNGDGFDDLVITAYGFTGAGGANEGAWFLYLGDASGTNSTADAFALGGQAGARLGSSAAGVGDVNGDGFADFVVGAEFFDNGSTDEGVVFLYLGGASFNSVSDATLEINQGSAFFGHSVAGAGDVNGDGFSDVLVGANGFDGGSTNSGGAFLFFGNAGAFNTTSDATLTSSQGDVRMGTSVAGVGDVNADGFDDVLIGAPEYEAPLGASEANEGAAFLYLGGSGAFNIATDAHFQINQLEARVGSSVAGVGDVNGDGFADMIIGAPLQAAADSGSAYIIFGSAAPVTNPPASVTLFSSQAGANFGSAVAGAGDVNGDGFSDVLVGARGYDNGENDEGAVFVYLGGSTFSTTTYRHLEFNQANAALGNSIAAADVNRDGFADVLVGAALFDGVGTDNGRAQLFLGGGLSPNTGSEGVAFGNQGSSQMGQSVAVGDVNGDGYADLVAGHNGHDDNATNSGRVSVFLGGAGGFNTSADDTIPGQLVNERMGASVAVGDLNADGYADIVAGAPFANRGAVDEGAVYIFLSDAGIFGTTPNVILQADQAGASFGVSVALPGDIDGDGANDLLVGAPLFDGSVSNEGAMFVYMNRNLAFAAPDFTLLGSQGSAFFGGVVAGAGDVNGDGFADIMAGGVGFDATGATNAGVVRVYHGGRPFNTVVDLTKDGGLTDARFGSAVAGLGDVNGDGFADVLMAANEYSSGEANEGVAWIYPGSATGLNPVPTWRVEGNQANAGFGSAAASAGDVNGDGLADFIVGAPDYDNGVTVDAGAAFLFLGAVSGQINPNAAARFDFVLSSTRAGTSVSAGDFNGDGFSDLTVGAPSDDNGASTDEGSASVFYGNTTGRANPMQTFDFVNLSLFALDQWGVSAYGDFFTVGGDVVGPRGRENAKLEVQACPQGAAFGAPTCVTAMTQDWTPLSAAGAGTVLVAFPQVIGANSLFHWRARALYLHQTGTNAALTPPSNPRVGPWRRLRANADLQDVRVTQNLFKDGFE